MVLKNTNNDVMENPKNGDNSLKDSEPFKKLLPRYLYSLRKPVASHVPCLYLHSRRIWLHVHFQICVPQSWFKL